MMEEYKTVDKYDRAMGGLLSGNSLKTKATTMEEVEPYTGETESFIVQTIRDEKGDHVSVKFIDKDGVKRLILPPKVVLTIIRQRDALSSKLRRNHSKASMKARMDAGFVPNFQKKRS
jgi:phage/plasmid primase-like uncharacterized protein